jgi:hypothetical protein
MMMAKTTIVSFDIGRALTVNLMTGLSIHVGAIGGKDGPSRQGEWQVARRKCSALADCVLKSEPGAGDCCERLADD